MFSFNVKTVALSALPSGGQDGSQKAVELGKKKYLFFEIVKNFPVIFYGLLQKP